MSETALVFVAHGSRRKESNEEITELVTQLEAVCGDQFVCVTSAFLELAIPSIPDAVSKCIANGASRVVIYPYFLAAGRHVAEDIPRIASECRLQHPGTLIDVARYTGQSGGLMEFLQQEITTATLLASNAELNPARAQEAWARSM
ncbi:MAG: sirohydrochlorin chelatase [bacterium]